MRKIKHKIMLIRNTFEDVLKYKEYFKNEEIEKIKETILKIENSFGINGENFFYQEQQAFDCEIENIQMLHDNIDKISKKIAFMNCELEDIREEEERQNEINAFRNILLKEKENIKVVVVGQYVWDDFNCNGGEIIFRILLGKKLHFLYFIGKNDFLQEMFTCYNEEIGIKTEFLSDFAKKEVEDIFFNLLEKGNIKSYM
jgi:cupin superfamily acireductone dioxygenase involved in methionine salvage